MALEFIKESINLNQVIARQAIQFDVAGDIIVPDSKPDILKVLYVGGDVRLTAGEARTDRILAQGEVELKVLYASGESGNIVKSIQTGLPFEQSMQVSGLI